MLMSAVRLLKKKLFTNMLDSEAEFSARVLEIGFPHDALEQMKSQGFNTFGKVAFATNFIPGQSDDSALITFSNNIFQIDPPSPGQLSLVRRLVYESYTMAATDLKIRMERKDDDAPRRLAQAERSARYNEQKARLSGLDLTGELECSNRLIDMVYSMAEEGSLKYIKWEDATKRDQELMGLRSDPVWKPDAQGIIRESKVQEVLKADYKTDLQLKFVLQRRSLALDQTRLVDYDLMEKWSKIMLEAYTNVPPEGYSKVSLEQLQRADLELFKYLMRECRSGIKTLSGRQPLAEALKEAIKAPEIRLCLQPMPSGSLKRKADQSDENLTKKSREDPEISRLKEQVKNLQGQIKNAQTRQLSSSSQKGKKGNGKGKNKMIRLPPPLIGMSPTTASGEPNCYDYNLKKCDKAAPGQRCSKGWHLCMRHGCGQAHSQLDHA